MPSSSRQLLLWRCFRAIFIGTSIKAAPETVPARSFKLQRQLLPGGDAGALVGAVDFGLHGVVLERSHKVLHPFGVFIFGADRDEVVVRIVFLRFPADRFFLDRKSVV